MTTLATFHGKQSIKSKYLERVRAHEAADEIIHGVYWENGKGCAVGCTIEGSDHERYETELGIPKEVAFLEDVIFENLENGEAKKFPAQFLNAVGVGKDLSKVTAQVVIWQFEDEKWGLKNIPEVKEDNEVMGWCERVVALYKRDLEGKKASKEEYYQLYLEIHRAWAWAGAGARAWAGAKKQKRILALRDYFLKLISEAPDAAKK